MVTVLDTCVVLCISPVRTVSAHMQCACTLTCSVVTYAAGMDTKLLLIGQAGVEANTD